MHIVIIYIDVEFFIVSTPITEIPISFFINVVITHEIFRQSIFYLIHSYIHISDSVRK